MDNVRPSPAFRIWRVNLCAYRMLGRPLRTCGAQRWFAGVSRWDIRAIETDGRLQPVSPTVADSGSQWSAMRLSDDSSPTFHGTWESGVCGRGCSGDVDWTHNISFRFHPTAAPTPHPASPPTAFVHTVSDCAVCIDIHSAETRLMRVGCLW